MRILNIDMEIYSWYIIELNKLSVVWSHFVKYLIPPPPSNFMCILRDRDLKSAPSSAFWWFPLESRLGLEWGKSWLNEHTCYFMYFSIAVSYSLLNILQQSSPGFKSYLSRILNIISILLATLDSIYYWKIGCISGIHSSVASFSDPLR